MEIPGPQSPTLKYSEGLIRKNASFWVPAPSVYYLGGGYGKES